MNRAPFALVLLASIAGAQTTWYVDAHAPAPGTGTQASPFKRIQYAISQPTTIDGDTLLVAPGTYVENIHTNQKRITLRSSHGPEVTVIKPAVAGSVITLGDLTTIGGPPAVLEGFEVTGVISLNTFNGDEAAVTSFAGVVRRCIVHDNHGWPGIGIDVWYDAAIYDCVLTRNTQGVRLPLVGSALHELRGSIVAGNTSDIYGVFVGAPLVEYCAGLTNVYPQLTGAHNVFADPWMWDPEHGDFRLAHGSPCIDAGDPNAPHDPDGSPRDIGPFAYEAGYTPPPTAYCTAKTNSLGCVPTIGAVGNASASGAPFTITCSNQLNNKLGVLFYGYIQSVQPYEGGYFCIWPFLRTPASYAQGNVGVDDCSGVFTLDFNARIQSGLDAGLIAGEIVYAQFWSRDPNSTFQTNRSDALKFGIAP